MRTNKEHLFAVKVHPFSFCVSWHHIFAQN